MHCCASLGSSSFEVVCLFFLALQKFYITFQVIRVGSLTTRFYKEFRQAPNNNSQIQPSPLKCFLSTFNRWRLTDSKVRFYHNTQRLFPSKIPVFFYSHWMDLWENTKQIHFSHPITKQLVVQTFRKYHCQKDKNRQIFASQISFRTEMFTQLKEW